MTMNPKKHKGEAGAHACLAPLRPPAAANGQGWYFQPPFSILTIT
jgi:hypothetical protein